MHNLDSARPAQISRRVFAGTLAATLLTANDSWIPLFDGKSLKGWRPNENRNSWKVKDGVLSAEGPRSHLFYQGPVQQGSFRNFELEVEAMARHECNSGIYFHTQYQESGFPNKGFEIQINNTATGEGNYRERKKTGSLYGIRNVYKQLVADNEWFKLQVAVRGKNVQVRWNGTLLVDYVEPSPAVVPPGEKRERFLDRGTFALQCHNDGSYAQFRSIRVRPLPDNVETTGTAPVVDETYRRILAANWHNVPMLDAHVHLKANLTLEQALAKSRQDGIQYGLAVNCGRGFPVQDDASALRFLESLKGQPVFIAMQGEGREWTKMFSQSTIERFDYAFTDSMTWTNDAGRRMRLWIPDDVGTIDDPQDFMRQLVDRTVGILNREPINIYVNPTFLPEVIAKDYDRLWTEPRMKQVIDAAVKNGIAIELNNRYKLPSAAFIKMAKAAGCKFSFGTNNSSIVDLGRCEYGLHMLEECKLRWQDFFVPGAVRKG